MPKKRNAANPFGIADAAPKPTNMQNPYAVPEEDDVAANVVAEENFNQGARQNAMEYSTADNDGDNMLDFEEFCALVREREQGEFTEQTLRMRFDLLDGDKSGKVDMREYIQFALRDALARSSTRVLDLFREWDDDGNGKISRKEFARAIRALGFNAPKEQLAITENPACIPLPELSDEAQASILKSRLYRGFLHEMRQRTDFSEYLTGEH